MTTITLSQHELNMVLHALAALPYEQSGAVIANILEQIKTQEECL